MAKRALITGITGQDGSYLAELLLSKGYQVFGLMRRVSVPTLQRIRHILDQVTLIQGDLIDQLSLINAVEEVQPDEVYNLGAMSFVPVSFRQPILTGEYTALGALRLLEAVRLARPSARFYQASSSEMFGRAVEVPQSEHTPFYPRSPYGTSKVFAHWATINYRESYDMYAVSGILFNHESPRRGSEFVTRKVSLAVSRIALGLQDELVMGTLEPKRDWGYAPEYVEAMWRMLQQPNADDYVIATGETHSVRELVACAFAAVGIEDWERLVRIDPSLARPNEVELLLGDPRKAEQQLGWQASTRFAQLVQLMVAADLDMLKQNPSFEPAFNG